MKSKIGTSLAAATLAAGLLGYATRADADGTAARTPVLVELFTSEGCSSCPPADRLLQKLDQGQPVAGAEAIVLSEHVDYWNDSGWKDPYSLHLFTERQQAYAERIKGSSSYTPQMVVDGTTEFVGSDSANAWSAITRASKLPKAAVRLKRTGGELEVHVDGIEKHGAADVYVALADNEDASQVLHGENGGRQLRHVAVVRSLASIGSLRGGAEFEKTIPLDFAKGTDPRKVRFIAFVQEHGPGRVLGAAMISGAQ